MNVNREQSRIRESKGIHPQIGRIAGERTNDI
jgi:hypothetical protein